jgi:hypothetical protein
MSLGSIARAAVAAAVLLSAGASVQAATVTYTLVPAESGLGLTGTIGDDFIAGGGRFYAPGSTGTLTADRTANTVNFAGGSVTVANQGSFSPRPGGDSRTAPANFGFTANGPFGSTVQGAIRNLKFHVVSDGPTTIGADGRIATDSFEIAIDSGTYSFLRNDGEFDDIDLSGTTPSSYKFNESNTKPSFSNNAGSEYLTLPFQFSVLASTFTTRDTTLTFTGSFEGPSSAPVPEPAGLLLLPALGLLARRRRLA